MWTCKKHDKSGWFGECSQCKNEKEIELIYIYWRFDNNQQSIRRKPTDKENIKNAPEPENL